VALAATDAAQIWTHPANSRFSCALILKLPTIIMTKNSRPPATPTVIAEEPKANATVVTISTNTSAAADSRKLLCREYLTMLGLTPFGTNPYCHCARYYTRCTSSSPSTWPSHESTLWRFGPILTAPDQTTGILHPVGEPFR
jgi:hypothetical protein